MQRLVVVSMVGAFVVGAMGCRCGSRGAPCQPCAPVSPCGPVDTYGSPAIISPGVSMPQTLPAQTIPGPDAYAPAVVQ